MSASSPLATLLSLEEYTRTAATQTELAFVMVNDTHALAPYRQAIFHSAARGVEAVSGVSSLEPEAPFLQWLKQVFRVLGPDISGEIGPEDLPVREASDWAEWLPPYAWAAPVSSRNGERLGTLVFATDQPWGDAEKTLVSRATAMYGPAWEDRTPPAPLFGKRLLRWRRLLLGAALTLVMVLPVRLSVLAPAEIVPSNPAVIRAPMEGVIETIAVSPNQVIVADDILFTLDRTSIIGHLAVADKALATARAELDKATQQSFSDRKAKANIKVLRARVAEKHAERAQLNERMIRARAMSPRSGVVVMDDPSEWIGRPVSVGEKVLAVADPTEVEVEVWLAPDDLIELKPGAPVTVFLNTAPLTPISAKLSYIAYEATRQPDNLLAHRVRAAINKDDLVKHALPRIGLKGTARLDGERVLLIYWLLRRPLGITRQWLGW